MGHGIVVIATGKLLQGASLLEKTADVIIEKWRTMHVMI